MVERIEHSGTAAASALAGDITSGGLTIACVNLTGWPTGSIGKFYATIGRGTPTEETVLCTTRSANTLTVDPAGRGADGSAASAHSAGATIEHTWTAAEADEASAHLVTTSGAHGVVGALVGTTDTQTLSNKTIDGTANTFANIPQSAVSGLVAKVAAYDAHVAATAVHGATGAVVGTSNTQTLTNKTIDGASNTVTNIPQASVTGLVAKIASLDAHVAATDVHGATGAVVGTTNTQTLTNKTLTSPTINTPTITDAVITGLTLDGEVVSGAYEAYTPTWAASGTAPSIGNGTLGGWFKRIGNTIFYRIYLVAGSTTSFGTGTWSWTLPDGLSVEGYAAPGVPMGTAVVRDNSPVTRYPMHAYCNTASTLAVIFYDGSIVGQTYPWTWANGDSLMIVGHFEVNT